jgi:predicted transcriptional regulator
MKRRPGRPKSEKRRVIVSITLPPELRDQVDVLAYSADTSRGRVIECFIRAGLAAGRIRQ